MSDIEITEGFRLVREKIISLLDGDGLQGADGEYSRIIVGIDGRCGSGKSVLARWLQSEFDGNLFCMDDFYLRREQRTPARLAEIGGNVDYERFREEVMDPLLSGEEVVYRRFDCSTFTMQSPEIIPRKRLNLVEGSYSLHPYLGDVYDLRVFMTVDPETQLARIRRRSGEEKLERCRGEWIPKKEAYIRKFHPDKGALLISGGMENSYD